MHMLILSMNLNVTNREMEKERKAKRERGSLNAVVFFSMKRNDFFDN